MWTSYSDLFLGLSVIFLLLYVTASLRQGTDGIRQFLNNKELEKENSDLKQQLKVYDSLKNNYLNNQSSESEQETYDMLMKKLELLQDDANNEKNELLVKAKENEDKEKALNQYQQVIRNIINANLIAKARITNRDDVITQKEDVIKEKSTEISSLEQDLKSRSEEIQKGKYKITKLEKSLSENLNELKMAYAKKRISEERFKEQQEILKQEANNNIALLKQEGLVKEAEIEEIKEQHEQLQSKLKQTEGQYSETKAELSKAKAGLAKVRENLQARKKIAQSIKGKFKDMGIEAEIDAGTGDVLLGFGSEYFDTGAAKLKPGMKKVLEKALPSYAQSLFEDPKISEKIENVEIVGFASPTFNGKYVDPSSLNKKDRLAVTFNLDLSYKRARSIFDYLYSNTDFQYKQRLMPLVKVTGRSFLGDKSNQSTKESAVDFCQKFDCAKKQTVIIKFKLRD